jgi:hypothetical protein
MALLICHECGGRVSTEAAACPQCGAPPKKGLSSLPSAPPVIAAPLSEPVRQEILKLAKTGFGQIIVWTLFILGLNASSGSASLGKTNEFVSLVTFVCGVYVFRSWCQRRAYCVILKRGSLRHVYGLSLGSFYWRSSLVAAGVGLVLGGARGSSAELVFTFTFTFLIWSFMSLFTLDVPYWCRRRVEGIIETARAKTMPYSPAPQPTATPPNPSTLDGQS